MKIKKQKPTTSSTFVTVRHDFEDIVYSLGNNLEQKMFYELLAKINPREPYQGQDLVLTASELTALGVGKSHLYRNFMTYCENLRKMCVRSYSESVASQDGNKETLDEGISIFDSYAARGQKNKAGKISVTEVKFSISAKAAPYLTSITKDVKFSRFLIDQIRNFKKAPSGRLYQWLRRCHWITIRRPITSTEITLDELRAKLDFDTTYPLWGDFRRYLLTPSLNEINKKSDIKASYTKGKTGRGGKIITLIFTIENQSSGDINQKTEVETIKETGFEGSTLRLDAELEALIRLQLPAVTEETLGVLASYDRGVILDSILALAGQISTKKIKEPIPFFLKIVANKSKEEVKSPRKKKSTIEKITDTSWADDDWIEVMENES